MRKLLVTLAVFLSIFAIYAGGTSESADDGNITLRFSWWGGDSRHEATLDVIELYESLNPGITIEGEYMGAVNDYRQKLFTQFAGQAAPDIIQLDSPWMPEIYKMGDLLVDLNTKTDLIDISGFSPEFLESYSIKDGHLYTLPTGINSIILTINKQILEEAGIDPNTVWNWENFITEGKKVHQNDSEKYFFNTDQVALATVILKTYIIQKTGNQFLQDDYTLGFTREDLIEAFEYMNRLFEEGVVEPPSDCFQYSNKFEQNPLWVNSKAGVIATWNSTIMMWSAHFLDVADVTNIPIRQDAKNTGVMVRPAQLLAVNKNSKHVDECVKFLDFFFNDPRAIRILKDSRSVQPTENARALCLEENLTNPLVVKAAEIAQDKAGIVYNDLSNNQEFIDIFTTFIEGVALGRYTPEEGADEMIAVYTQKLAEYKAQNS